MKLYHFAPSAPSRAALMAARTVGVDVDIVEVNLFQKEQLRDEFIQINPQHTVPTIVDDDFVLWESRAICGYLVEQYAESDSLYPKKPSLRAVVNEKLNFDCNVLYQRIRAICFPALYLGETKISKEKRDKLEEALSWMEIFLQKNQWVAGDHMTIADISCAASLSSVVEVGYDLSKRKLLENWLRKCQTQIKGYDENLKGAQMFGTAVRNKLEDKL